MRRLIKRLQENNYMIEKCDICGSVADRYIEQEFNLKIFSVFLLEESIYRHIYFNSITIEEKFISSLFDKKSNLPK